MVSPYYCKRKCIILFKKRLLESDFYLGHGHIVRKISFLKLIDFYEIRRFCVNLFIFYICLSIFTLKKVSTVVKYLFAAFELILINVSS